MKFVFGLVKSRKPRLISHERQNTRYLSGFVVPASVHVSHDLRACVSGAGIVLSVIPSRYVRPVIQNAAEFISSPTPVVSATKGIEEGTLARMSELISSTLNDPTRVAVLSGPTFAREIAAGEPAAIVIAAHEMALAEEIQQAFATPALRFYTSDDVIGVEIGAALKNVIALGAGICSGLGLGSNSVAALITRGLAEITRLACALGGKPQTLSGLAGLGDLVLTATGHLSRNRSVGIQLGQGRKLRAILGETKMVAEGVWTCQGSGTTRGAPWCRFAHRWPRCMRSYTKTKNRGRPSAS